MYEHKKQYEQLCLLSLSFSNTVFFNFATTTWSAIQCGANDDASDGDGEKANYISQQVVVYVRLLFILAIWARKSARVIHKNITSTYKH